MGWDGIYRGHGIETAAQKVADDFKGLEIVAKSSKGSTHYLAVRHPKTPEDVFACVVLTRVTRDEIMSKVIEETSGPCECDASAKVLDALTPTTSQWANEWRAKARARLAETTAQRARAAALRVRDQVEVLNCRSIPAVEVVALRRGRGVLGRCLRTGRLYKIPASMIGRTLDPAGAGVQAGR